MSKEYLIKRNHHSDQTATATVEVSQEMKSFTKARFYIMMPNDKDKFSIKEIKNKIEKSDIVLNLRLVIGPDR